MRSGSDLEFLGASRARAADPAGRAGRPDLPARRCPPVRGRTGLAVSRRRGGP